jgi:hypothetical protein
MNDLNTRKTTLKVIMTLVIEYKQPNDDRKMYVRSFVNSNVYQKAFSAVIYDLAKG